MTNKIYKFNSHKITVNLKKKSIGIFFLKKNCIFRTQNLCHRFPPLYKSHKNFKNFKYLKKTFWIFIDFLLYTVKYLVISICLRTVCVQRWSFIKYFAIIFTHWFCDWLRSRAIWQLNIFFVLILVRTINNIFL